MSHRAKQREHPSARCKGLRPNKLHNRKNLQAYPLVLFRLFLLSPKSFFTKTFWGSRFGVRVLSHRAKTKSTRKECFCLARYKGLRPNKLLNRKNLQANPLVLFRLFLLSPKSFLQKLFGVPDLGFESYHTAPKQKALARSAFVWRAARDSNP